MEKEKLRKLAQKIQLELKENELTEYAQEFNQLEKLLTNFKKVKINQRIKPMARINVGYLTLSDLEKVKKKSSPLINKKNLKKNCLVNKENLVLFKKTNQT
jgi:Asp-tRNA(Asn)/Glu-tRNA(Gln) amidotransferase C subunit